MGPYVLVQLCKSVVVFGVGAGATSTSSWHYWEQRNFGESREFGLEPHHSFELEHDLAMVFAAAGLVKHHKVDGEGGEDGSGAGAGAAKDVAPEILRLAKEKKKERLKAEKEAERARKEAEEAAKAAAAAEGGGGAAGLPGDPLRMARP